MDAFAVNVLPVVKVDEWREFATKAASGEHADEHRAMLRRFGVDREHLFLQQTPQGALMVLIWEGLDDTGAAHAMGELMSNPQSDYERTALEYVIRELHGIDPSSEAPPPIEKVATIDV